MKFLRSGKVVSKTDLAHVYRVAEDASIQGLREIRPLIEEVLVKVVGTQYYSLATLRKMGHPYKSKAPGGLKPGVINVQSGDFFRAFKVIGPVRATGAVTIWVENDSSTGERLEAGGRMIKRPWKSYLMWNLYRAINPVLGPLIAKNIKIRGNFNG